VTEQFQARTRLSSAAELASLFHAGRFPIARAAPIG